MTIDFFENYSDRVISNQSYIEAVDPPVDFLENILIDTSDEDNFVINSKEKVWTDVLNTHNTTIRSTKKILRRFEKKSLQIFGVKIGIVFVNILYSFRRVLDGVFEFESL